MGVRFACHACGKRLNIKTELAGKRGICPACSVRFRIPPNDTEVSTPLESTSGDSDESISVSNQASASVSKAADSNAAGFNVSAKSDDSQSVGGVAVRESTENEQLVRSGEVAVEPSVPPATHRSLQEVLGDHSATWYVRPPNGGQYGPADGPTMGQWMKEGRVAGLAMVWRDGWTDWRLAKDAVPGVIPNEGVGHNPAQPSTHAAAPMANAPGVDVASAGQRSEVAADPAADLELAARSGPLGSNKKKRSRNRVLSSVFLGLLFLCLIGALAYVLTRG